MAWLHSVRQATNFARQTEALRPSSNRRDHRIMQRIFLIVLAHLEAQKPIVIVGRRHTPAWETEQMQRLRGHDHMKNFVFDWCQFEIRSLIDIEKLSAGSTHVRGAVGGCSRPTEAR